MNNMKTYYGSSQFGPVEPQEPSMNVRYLVVFMGIISIFCIGILLGLKIGGRI